jgi:tetratricopeptide (TPR) repeat protein
VQVLQADPASASWDWRKDTALAVVVLLAAFAVFANSLPNGFVYDDVQVIEQNPRLATPWDLKVFFARPYWSSEQGNAAGLYRPLTLWLFALQRALFGAGPFGIHLVNVLANALLGGLVYALLWLLVGHRGFAFLCSLLYALQPVHTEVVANGVGQAEITAGLCVILAVLFHLRYLRRALPRPGAAIPRAARRRGEPVAETEGRYADVVWAAGLYFVGLLCKESVVVLPGLVFLAEWLVLRRGDLLATLRQWRRYALYVPPLALYLIIRAAVVGRGLPAVQEVMAGVSTGQRLLHAWGVIFNYLGQTLLPLHLCAEYADYTRMVARVWTPLAVSAVLAGVVVSAVLCGWLYRRRWYLPLFGLGWFFLSLLPASNLLFPVGTIRADRLLFIPSLGVMLCLGWLLTALFRQQRQAGALVSALFLCFYGWRTVTRNLDWRSSESLWLATVERNPGSPIGWRFVGDTYRDRGDLKQAAEAYRKAIDLREGAGFPNPDVHSRYAGVLAKLGQTREAEAHYRKVLEREPRHMVALNNLGEQLLLRGVPREAAELFQRAAAAEPDSFMPWANLAQATLALGELDRALSAVQRAIRLAPAEKDLLALQADIVARRDRARAASPEAKAASPGTAAPNGR